MLTTRSKSQPARLDPHCEVYSLSNDTFKYLVIFCDLTTIASLLQLQLICPWLNLISLVCRKRAISQLMLPNINRFCGLDEKKRSREQT